MWTQEIAFGRTSRTDSGVYIMEPVQTRGIRLTVDLSMMLPYVPSICIDWASERGFGIKDLTSKHSKHPNRERARWSKKSCGVKIFESSDKASQLRESKKKQKLTTVKANEVQGWARHMEPWPSKHTTHSLESWSTKGGECRNLSPLQRNLQMKPQPSTWVERLGAMVEKKTLKAKQSPSVPWPLKWNLISFHMLLITNLQTRYWTCPICCKPLIKDMGHTHSVYSFQIPESWMEAL